jgi:hypothetical protein
MIDSGTDEMREMQARYWGFVADEGRLAARLAELDVQREDTRMQLERIRRVVAELGPLCGYYDTNNLSAHGITDACRAVIRKAHPEYLSANDIKERLEKGGFDLSKYQNPSASIYTILTRLEESNFAEKKMEGFNVLYRSKRLPRLGARRARAIRGEVKKITG